MKKESKGLRVEGIKGFAILALYLFILLSFAPPVAAQAPFYQGRTISIVAGYVAGDGFDIWARLFARHMPKHIPGIPGFIVQNMPGAGSMIAANYVYNVAKPDGLTLGVIAPSLYFDQLVGRKEVQYDWTKFTWIGTPEQTDQLLFVRADSPYRTIEDIRKAAEPPKCGATGTASTGYYLPKLFEETLGLKFRIVTGYPGGGDIDLAVERGEVHCRAFTVSTFFGREPFETWRKRGFVRVLVQTGRKRDARAPDVPTIYELMEAYKTPEAGRRLATVILASAVFGRPMVAAPGIPADRIKMLRDAFNQALGEPEFLEETKNRRWIVEPVSGEELEALAKEVIGQPPEVIERMIKVLGR